jgi:hypothetical protein
MSLPELDLQIIYARIAWGLIAAAMLLSVLPTLLPKVFHTWPTAPRPSSSPLWRW